jgi:hypothetical protein
MNLEFWKLLFIMRSGLYALKGLLCLEDQKTPAMDKLYYYVLGNMDAQYIADIVKPLITQMESKVDIHNKRSPGIVDLGIFMETAMFRILA